MTNKRSSLGISIFLLLDLGVDDVVLEDGRVLDPGSPVAVLEPEAVLHVGGHAQVALVRRNQNLKRTLVLVLQLQSGASYLSQGFVTFFQVSRDGLPGQ